MSEINLNIEDRIKFNEIFQSLKPICDDIALNPFRNHSDSLAGVLKSIDFKFLHALRSYILFPLEVHLFNVNKNNDETKCNLLGLLEVFLDYVQINDINIFFKVYTVIFLQLNNKSDPGRIPELSEELKLRVVSCANLLFNRTSRAVLELFYDRKYFPKFSLSISQCIALAKNEDYIKLRVKALDCIMVLMQIDNLKFINEIDGDFYQKVIDVSILMVPGLLSTAVIISKGNETQNHKVFVSGLQLWSRVVCLLLHDTPETPQPEPKIFEIAPLPLDSEISPIAPGDFLSYKSLSKEEFIKNMIKEEKRDSSWLRKTDQKMIQVTEIILNLQNHPHWKVRKELVTSISLILSVAPKNMKSSLGYFVDSLIKMNIDDNESVSQSAKKYLDGLLCKSKTTTEKKIHEIIEENFYQLITRLPRVLRGTDEVQKLNDLSLLCGYIKLLGPSNLPRILNSAQHLYRFVNALIEASILDSSNVSLLEEISLRDIEDEMYGAGKRWKQLKICKNSKLILIHREICKALRDSCDLATITTHLLDILSSDSSFRKEKIFLLNEIFLNGPPDCLVEYQNLVKAVLTCYMDSTIWYVPVTVGKKNILTKEVAQENVIQICLLCEGISRLAVGVGKDLFSFFLLKCFYPLLECAGSSICDISAAGMDAVKKIAGIYGGGVSQLVAQNVDYLSHHVTLRLRNAHKDSRVLSVLTVIMKNSASTVLPPLYEIINHVLVQSCDDFQNYNLKSFLYVFHTFVECEMKWLGLVSKSPTSTHLIAQFQKQVVEEIVNYHKTKMVAENLDDNEHHIDTDLDNLSKKDFGEGITEEPMEMDEDKPPNYIDLTVAIIKRSLHFLPIGDLPQQILILQILNCGIIIIEKWSKELFPVVHKIWSPLVERFSVSGHPLLIHRSLQLLLTLSRTSKDFIRVRTIKEVLPILCEILVNSAKDSQMKDVGHAYRYSQLYKLQLGLLQGLGQLAIDTQFLEKELYDLLVSSQSYLSSLQPHPLQDACKKMWLSIATLNADIVWLMLTSLCSEKKYLKPLLSSFKGFKIETQTLLDDAHINRNVLELLGAI